MPLTARPLRIAQVAPLIERVPPMKYGGTERVVSALTEGLVARGHEVTLFAAGDARTKATLVSGCPHPLREAGASQEQIEELTIANLGRAYLRQSDFDLIHDHLGFLSLPTAQLATAPVVVTLHGSWTPSNRELYHQFDRPHYVTISSAQAKGAEGRVRISATIHHGIDVAHYPFGPDAGDYLLFVGRLSPEKAPHLAIEVAHSLNLPLILAAKLDPADLGYMREQIEPKLDGDRVRWIGEVDETERNRLMAGALCLVNPIQWQEPFGLVMVEAMACGLPVVAFRGTGATDELVVDGTTGFLVKDVAEMVDAVRRIAAIDRNACRRHVERSFSVERMVEAYEQLYRSLVQD